MITLRMKQIPRPRTKRNKLLLLLRLRLRTISALSKRASPGLRIPAQGRGSHIPLVLIPISPPAAATPLNIRARRRRV